jgi:hypothetical protein
MKKARFWLCIPPLLAAVADLVATLLGQPAAYWTGSLLYAREGAPHGLWLFQQHRLAFPIAFGLWMLLFSAAILYGPRRLARAITLAVVMGHGWGAIDWIYASAGYWLCILATIVLAIITEFVLEKEADLPEARSLQ